jgi:hypothetical protein
VSTSDVGEVENVGSHEGSIQADDEVQCQMLDIIPPEVIAAAYTSCKQ